MQLRAAFFALLCPLLVASAPAHVRRASAADTLVFQFADVLNQLEMTFYQEAMKKFTASDLQAAGFASGQAVTEQMNQILSDEQEHIKTLQKSIQSFGAAPVTSCKFDVSSALTDVKTMSTVARVFELTGVSAFLGAAPLLTDPVLLTAAASILSVEARHSTMLNALNTGSAIPAAFDIPLTPSEILAIASPFISDCDLGVPANPSLTVTNTGALTPGTTLSVSSPAINGTTDGLFCQMLVGGMSFSMTMPLSSCVVPSGINGPVAMWVTSDNQPLLGNAIDRATSQLVAGPGIIFVDTSPETFSQFVRPGDNMTSVTRRILTPDEAQVVMNAASKQ
jgi:hypothetical protein